MWRPTAGPRECWPSRDASTSSWEVTRRERSVMCCQCVYAVSVLTVALLEFSLAVLSVVIWCVVINLNKKSLFVGLNLVDVFKN